MTGMVQEKILEKKTGKQKGCMGGFFQIFDTGKRLHTIKRLPSTASREATLEQEKNVESPATPKGRSEPSPEISKQSPEPFITTGSQNNSPRRGPVFEFNEKNLTSPWKFSKEAPRLSLDSRAVIDPTGSLKSREIRTNTAISSLNQCESNREEDGVDGIDKQRRSPSVVARLMGLEAPLPDSDPEPNKQAELRRSASEARGRDLFQSRFIDGVDFHLKQSQQSNLLNGEISSNLVMKNGSKKEKVMSSGSEGSKNARDEPVKTPVRGMIERKLINDSVDFFPETKQTVSIYGEIEKRLKLRGIEEPSKDLETVKQFLEVLQLKGLLHSTKRENQRSDGNFAYEHEQSPIVVIKPAAIRRTDNVSPPSSYRSRPGARRNSNLESPPTMSPRRDRPDSERNLRNQSGVRGSISPTKSENGVKRPSGKPLSIETHRGNDNVEQRRVSPVQFTRVNERRTRLDQTTNRSPGNRISTADIYPKEDEVFIPPEDETSTASECSISSSSQTDTDRSKVEAYKEERSLLERCDKLLHSIAEMTAATAKSQLSPISVLDSSFYKDELSPSLVMQRRIDFKGFVESEDEVWSPASAMSSVESKSSDISDDCDFIYISDILRASNYLPDDADIFLLLEKQQHLKGKDTSKVYRLQRKLIFDTIKEILNRKGQLPPWKLNSWTGHTTSLQQIWSEFQKIRDRDSSDDLFEIICGVLRKDLAGDAVNGWEDCPIEMSEAVLYIERLIFKDLIVETIQGVLDFAGRSTKIPAICRKLVF
ncbi:protein LONGIFOLIA 1-like isoform X1 [Hibiscus syriacus]|nr:protein LONGIFOLIA 1-like isoform X1 [Hibiscus syriacus]